MRKLDLEGDSETRVIGALIGVFFSIALLLVFHFLLEGIAERLLIDRNFATYPLTVQNVMWVVFAIGFSELWVRHTVSNREMSVLRRQFMQ